MSDSIKKLLSIMNENTVSGAIAPVAGGVGKSMLKRPADSIFAAESVPQDADTGLESAPKVDSPANFGLWKNSAVIAKEQVGKHGRKKMAVNKTTMYPQLAEAAEPEQRVIDTTRKSRLGSERNAGLDEPDEKPDFGGGKSKDFGTWHFKFDSGNIVKKDGKPLLASSEKEAQGIVDRASQNGVTIRIVDGAPSELSETYNTPKDMADYNDDDWAKWDSKVNAVGNKAKEQSAKKLVRDRKTGEMYDPEKKFDELKNSSEFQAQMKRMATKEGVAEGTVIYGEPENKESFKVTYYDPKYDEQRTSTIKARNETAALDYCSSKGYDVIDIQRQGVAEAGNKPVEKSYFGMGDPRTPRDIKSQMRGASDRFVQSTADKDTGPIHSRVAKMQTKMAKSELRKRSDHDRMATGTNEGVAEGLSKRDQLDVAAIRAAIARLQAQLNHPNADRDAIQQSIAHEKKRLTLYGVTEGASLKKVKREYNVAAKDAGGDRPGAGKKIDDLKKRLRQRDVGKDKSITTEAGPRLVDKDGNEIVKKQSGPAPRTPDRELRSGDAYSTRTGVVTLTDKGLNHQRNTDTTPKPRFAENNTITGSKGPGKKARPGKKTLDEQGEWDGTAEQDLAAATAANGEEAGFADIEDKTSLSEAEITEEMIADRLKNELALFKKGAKPRDRSIGKKPADREVQEKKTESKSSMPKKSKKQ